MKRRTPPRPRHSITPTDLHRIVAEAVSDYAAKCEQAQRLLASQTRAGNAQAVHLSMLLFGEHPLAVAS